MEVTQRSSDLYLDRHSREESTQRILHVICALSNMESYQLFSLQNCVQPSLCTTIFLLMVLGAVPVSHSNNTRRCSVSPCGWGPVQRGAHRSKCSAVHADQCGLPLSALQESSEDVSGGLPFLVDLALGLSVLACSMLRILYNGPEITKEEEACQELLRSKLLQR